MKLNIKKTRFIIQLIFLFTLIFGLYSYIKPIMAIAILSTFIFGNFFCGFICPFGTAQEIMSKIGGLFIKKKFKMPQKFQKYLIYSRYIIALLILITGLLNISSYVFDVTNSYKNFMQLFSNFTLTISVVIMFLFLIGSMFFERFYCNYVCIEATKFGIFSLTRIFTIKRNSDTCINCKLCDKTCPMNIEIATKDYIKNPQCINCFKCIDCCPKDNTLTYGSIKKSHK